MSKDWTREFWRKFCMPNGSIGKEIDATEIFDFIRSLLNEKLEGLRMKKKNPTGRVPKQVLDETDGYNQAVTELNKKIDDEMDSN